MRSFLFRALVVVGLSFSFIACGGIAADPLAPSTVIPAITPVSDSTPPVTGAPFSIAIDANGGSTFTDTPWQTSVAVTGRSRPAQVNVNCNNGSDLQTWPGFTGSRVMLCAFPIAGTYTIVTTALSGDGFSVSDRTTVTASVRPVTVVLPPSVPPTPQAPTVNASIGCVPQKHGDPTPCNITATFGNTSITGSLGKVVWEYGDGNQATLTGPLSSYVYNQAGTYQIIAHVYYQDKEGDAFATVIIP